jgi:hypothetical protein
MPYSVKLKAGHPNGTYRRGGRVFSMAEATVLSDKDCVDAIKRDPWLVVEPLQDEKKKEQDEKK